MTDRELINKAVAASAFAYAPYSGFNVGAALECEDGTVYTGCNVENAALGNCICAERTALVKAVSEGRRSFKRMAVYADSDRYCMPCGTCRQMLYEFSPETEMLCVKSGGTYVSYKLSELLPNAFTLR
ncbi:MAG TPA: cytidine deaminase [Clostridiales bacterium]|jgi:cytidine deaminase|nr:cytidine deaminase [Clostridiales bacterium]